MTGLAMWIGGIITVLAWVFGYGAMQRRSGAKDAKAETALDAAERYAKQRKDADDADLGLGASDAERIKRLRDFADGGQ